MSSGGIEGKWALLQEEREDLKERVRGLEHDLEMARLSAKGFEDLCSTDAKDLAADRDRLQAQLEEARAGSASALMALTDEEQEAMDAIAAWMTIVVHRWKLKSNQSEMTAAVHVLQGFVVQHMLSRLSDNWGSWWEKPAPQGKDRNGVREAA